MNFFIRLARFFGQRFGREDELRDALRPLWGAVVETARARHWYLEGKIPDTLDGRFDMVAIVLALVLNRIESVGGCVREGIFLTELFITDMDIQIRQLGFGDLSVGKQVGRMMSVLGARLEIYKTAGDSVGVSAGESTEGSASISAGDFARDSVSGSPELRVELLRIFWRGGEHGEHPGEAALTHVVLSYERLRGVISAMPIEVLLSARVLPDGAVSPTD